LAAMTSSPLISLFGNPAPVRRGPSSFFISLVLHGIAFTLLFIGLNQPHKADPKSDRQRFTVRIMELDKPEPRAMQTGASLAAPGQASAATSKSGGSPDQAPAPRLPHNFVAQKDATRTLIQPVERSAIIPREAPLPQIVQWNPPDPTLNKIVAPPPQVVVKVDVKPTLDLPNREMHVADLKLSSTPNPTKTPMPTPSKTSPVNVQAPAEQAQRVPETTSKNSKIPTSGSVISLSDVQLQKGTAVLPMVSEIAPTPYAGPMSPGQPNSLSPNGTGRTDTKQNGSTAAGQTPGNQAGANAGKSGVVGTNGSNDSGVGKGGANGSANGGAGGGGAGGQGGANMAMAGETGISADTGGPSVVHLGLPRSGKFGVVVVGSALAEDYPETADLWRGRLAYTVYLHVGVTKNWILQYSLPRSDVAEANGDAGHLEAPWPYDITRPSIDADANADAIMVHGFVNSVGKFERLSIIFPTGLAETKFLLHALQQWEFRPAMQTGKATLVEILLIIPAESQ
jgi:hypothetical protein